jgi:hypothetical protein
MGVVKVDGGYLSPEVRWTASQFTETLNLVENFPGSGKHVEHPCQERRGLNRTVDRRFGEWLGCFHPASLPQAQLIVQPPKFSAGMKGVRQMSSTAPKGQNRKALGKAKRRPGDNVPNEHQALKRRCHETLDRQTRLGLFIRGGERRPGKPPLETTTFQVAFLSNGKCSPFIIFLERT